METAVSEKVLGQLLSCFLDGVGDLDMARSRIKRTEKRTRVGETGTLDLEMHSDVGRARTPFFSKQCMWNVKLNRNASVQRGFTAQVFVGMLNTVSAHGI